MLKIIIERVTSGLLGKDFLVDIEFEGTSCIDPLNTGCESLNDVCQNFTQPCILREKISKETLPKALRTQALTALTSNFDFVGLVWQGWLSMFGLVCFVL